MWIAIMRAKCKREYGWGEVKEEEEKKEWIKRIRADENDNHKNNSFRWRRRASDYKIVIKQRWMKQSKSGMVSWVWMGNFGDFRCGLPAAYLFGTHNTQAHSARKPCPWTIRTIRIVMLCCAVDRLCSVAPKHRTDRYNFTVHSLISLAFGHHSVAHSRTLMHTHTHMTEINKNNATTTTKTREKKIRRRKKKAASRCIMKAFVTQTQRHDWRRGSFTY